MKLNLNHTSEMEKAMQQVHGFGYAEYCGNFDKRIEVEKARESSYKKSLSLTQQISK